MGLFVHAGMLVRSPSMIGETRAWWWRIAGSTRWAPHASARRASLRGDPRRQPVLPQDAVDGASGLQERL
jgi:hypothetical protein